MAQAAFAGLKIARNSRGPAIGIFSCQLDGTARHDQIAGARDCRRKRAAAREVKRLENIDLRQVVANAKCALVSNRSGLERVVIVGMRNGRRTVCGFDVLPQAAAGCRFAAIECPAVR